MDRVLETYSLTEGQCNEIRALESLCYEQDGLGNHAWLSNEINFDQTFPCFYLAYDGDCLVAFLTTFIPTAQEAEIVAFTHPDYLNKGNFKKLYQQASCNLKKIEITRIIVAVEPKSVSGMQVLKHMPHQWLRSEYRMVYQDKVPTDYEKLLEFVSVTDANKQAFANVLNKSFDDMEDNDNFVTAVINNPDRKGYLAYLSNEPIGVFSLNLEDGNAFLYGVGILPEYRGKGFGKHLVYDAIKRGLSFSDKVLLDVDSDNPVAKKLYSNSGFETIFQVDYYVL